MAEIVKFPFAVEAKQSEWPRIAKAFDAIREAGGITVTHLPEQCASWAEAESLGADGARTVAMHTTEAAKYAFPNGRHRPMVNPLFVYHDGDTEAVVEALRAPGLRVQWKGGMDSAIEVLPDEDRGPLRCDCCGKEMGHFEALVADIEAAMEGRDEEDVESALCLLLGGIIASGGDRAGRRIHRKLVIEAIDAAIKMQVREPAKAGPDGWGNPAGHA